MEWDVVQGPFAKKEIFDEGKKLKILKKIANPYSSDTKEALKAIEMHKNKYRKYKTLFDIDLKNGDYVKFGECKGIFYVKFK